jgi:large conductance mechanosensitive channel
MKNITDDFVTFMKEYGVIGLAIGVVIGNATKDLVNSVVKGLIMPLVGIFLPGGNWQEVTVQIFTAEIRVGELLNAVLDFVIIAFLVYLFIRFILKKDEVETV